MTTQPTRRPFLGTYQEGTHVSAEVPEGFDWSRWYLTEEEDMGQSLEQFECIALLLSILTTLVRERGQQDDVYVGADQFFQWVQGEESVQVSPDLYIMQPHPPMPRPRSIQTWRRGHHPPRLAIEIVSIDWRKDYDENPPKYAQIGVEELLIFDPDAARNPALPGLEHEQERVALQLYQQHHGGLVCAERGQGPMFSEVLQAWLLVVSTPAGSSVALAQ
ncbi:MAG: Uma2 family endonuclease, partial [Myxococcota bacterium]